MQQIIDTEIQKLYPFKSNFLSLGKSKLHYVDEGEGDVVLLVHGNPTWSFYYRNMIENLKKSHRVIAVDHMGHGLSSKDIQEPLSLKLHIDNLEALIKKLDIETFSLVVHDWGGAIGFGLATRFPQMLKKAVLLNTSAFHLDRIPWQINLCKAKGVGPFIVKYFNAFAWPATFMASKKGLSDIVKRAYLAPYPTAKSRKGISDFVQDIPMSKEHPTFDVLKDIENKLPTLSCPKLILWGGADFCFNDDFFYRWRQIYPEAMFKYYPHAGHYVLEDESSDVIKRTSEFLGQVDCERSRSNIQ